MSLRLTRSALACAGLALAAVLSYGVGRAQMGVAQAEEVVVIREGTHPKLHEALRALREARTELKEARHDYGGHREESIKAIDVAIEQLEIAMKHAR